MASRSLGTLTLSLIAEIGGYTSGMDRAGRVAEANAKKSAAAWKEAGDELNSFVKLGTAGFAVLSAASTAAFAAIKGQADALDAFNDIKDATGASIEGISALDRVARETGSNIEAVESILVKFNSALKDAKPGDDNDRLFKALNLNIADLKQLDPAEALRRTAVAFGQFEDGGTKARAIQDLFGKSVKEAAPFLNDLAQKTALVGTTSTQTAAQAEIFNKQIFELRANAQDAARAFTADLLPALNTFLQNYSGLKQQGSLGLIVKDAAKDIFGLGKLTGDNAADIKTFMKQRDMLQAEMDKETRPLVRANDSRKEQIAELNQYLEIVRLKQRNEIEAQNFGQDYGDAVSRRQAKPLALPDYAKPQKGKTDNSAAQEAKAQLGLDLDAIKNAQEAFANASANQEKLLESMRAAGLTDESDYYKEKLRLLNENTASQVASQQATIARLESERLSGKDAIENAKKIADEQAKLTKIQADAATQVKVLGIEQEAAFSKVKASLLAARQAAQGYFDTVNQGYAREIAGIGQGTKNREMQAGITQIEQRYQQQRQDLQNLRAQAELAGTFGPDAKKQFDEQISVIDEFQTKAVDSYRSYYATIEEAQGNWINGALEGLRNYADEAGNVAKHMEDTVGDALKGIEDQFTNLLTGKKFDIKKLMEDLQADTARNFVKENITGPLASLGGDLLGFDGIKGGTLGSSASNPLYVRSADPLGGVAGSGSSGAGVLGQLFGGAAGLFGGFGNSTATAMANASGGGLDDLLKYTSLFAGFADGGFTGVGPKYEPAGIVHKGEYVLTADQTKQLGVANLDRGNFGGGRSMVVNNAFTINQPTSRKTQQQIAAEASRAMRTAEIRMR